MPDSSGLNAPSLRIDTCSLFVAHMRKTLWRNRFLLDDRPKLPSSQSPLLVVFKSGIVFQIVNYNGSPHPLIRCYQDSLKPHLLNQLLCDPGCNRVHSVEHGIIVDGDHQGSGRNLIKIEHPFDKLVLELISSMTQ